MKVLFIDTVHPVLWERLAEAGYICHEAYHLSRQALIDIIHDYDGIVIRSRVSIDQTFLEAASKLKFIARSGAGLENIDLSVAAKRNVEVFNSPEGNMAAVGEHCVGMLLCLFNHLNSADLEVRKGLWQREENRGIELAGKTVGIIGYGHMGKSFAQRLQGFGCQVLAYDKFEKNYQDAYCRETDMETIFQESDIVSLHFPGGPENFHLVNEGWLAKFKKNIYLINSSRGDNVDTLALVEGIKRGKVLGVCLDVLEFEKKSFDLPEWEDKPEALQYLLRSDRAILSPHVAGWTNESYFKLSDVLAEKILKIFS